MPSVRRSRFLVTFWEGGTHWVYNYLSRATHHCSARALAILEATSQWTGRAEILAAVRGAVDGEIDATIDEMVKRGFLDATGERPSAASVAFSAWSRWNPAAGFFHAVTKTPGTPDPGEVGHRDAPLVRERGFPAALKEYAGRPRVALPAGTAAGPIVDVLRSRRTWREFGDRKLTLDEIATLLGLTFGVQRWMDVGDDRWVALKSSPSGGARHSIEAYLLSFGVEGLENGTYHYCPDSHAVTLLGSPTPRDLLKAFVPGQPGFHDPAAFIVMTSVFERMQYKYPHPHAYRVVLLDAGHLSQTFALVATSLGLAPYCSAAVDAPKLEEHLEIDGIGEAVVLALGVGSRPPDKEWSPMHDHSAIPRTRAPAWAERKPGP